MKKFLLTTGIIITILKLSAQNKIDICKEAQEHYSPEEISQLSEKDIKKINFYYTASYKIDKTHPYYNEFVKKHCKKDYLDITYFEKYRKEENEIAFGDEEFPGLRLYLLPWKEIRKKYEEIENN